jgi:hypothetical protein
LRKSDERVVKLTKNPAAHQWGQPAIAGVEECWK